MKLFKMSVFSALVALSVASAVRGEEASRMRKLIQALVPYKKPVPEAKAASGDTVVMQPMQVVAKPESALPYYAERQLEEKLSPKPKDFGSVDGSVEIISTPNTLRHSFESSSIGELSLRGPELKKLRDGFEVSGVGTVWVKSGLRWQVEKKEPNLTRAVVSFHGGPMIQQSYTFKNEHDLWRNVVKKPAERILTMFDD